MFIRIFLFYFLNVPKSIVLMDDYIMRYNNVQNLNLMMHPPNSWIDSIANSKVETSKGQGIREHTS
jgi:hypothetical protein